MRLYPGGLWLISVRLYVSPSDCSKKKRRRQGRLFFYAAFPARPKSAADRGPYLCSFPALSRS